MDGEDDQDMHNISIYIYLSIHWMGERGMERGWHQGTGWAPGNRNQRKGPELLGAKDMFHLCRTWP